MCRKPRPRSPPHPGEGRGRESSSSVPQSFLGSFQTVCCRERSPRRCGAAAARASPGSCPQRCTKFPASGPRRMRSAEPGGQIKEWVWVGLSGLPATRGADAAPTYGAKRTLKSCFGQTRARISTVGDPGAEGSSPREMLEDPISR